MPKKFTLAVLICACLLLGATSYAQALSPEPATIQGAARIKTTPQAHPKARPLTPGERELMQELSQLRTERLKALRQEMHTVIDKAAKDGKITQEQAQRMKQHPRLPKHLRRHGRLPETGTNPMPTERTEGH